MSKAYPTWEEHSIVGKVLALLWFFGFLILGIAVAALLLLFLGAFLWALPGILWGDRHFWVIIAGGFVVALLWASVRGYE